MEVFQATGAGSASSQQLSEAPDLNLNNVVAADDVSTPVKKTPTAEMTGLTPTGFMTQLLENKCYIVILFYVVFDYYIPRMN